MRVAALAIDPLHIAALHAEEFALVATARAERLAEFASGRALLHDMLDTAAPIVRATNGAPAWPKGVVGSLAHDRTQAVAVVASAAEYRAIGIDIEPHGAGDDDELREAVLRTDDPDIDALAAFVMKEAAYKAWSDLGGEIVGPLEVRLTVDASNFAAEMPNPGMTVHGTITDTGGNWLAIATIR
ncbi:MAG: hypothetical protein K8R99_01840 [Actinomycetia bacterium]|nr:hypothetical protein [Actinomycetes bacterium]